MAAAGKSQLEKKIAAFPGMKTVKYCCKNSVDEGFQSSIEVWLSYSGEDKVFGAWRDFSVSKQAADESAARNLLKDEFFQHFLDCKQWNAPLDSIYDPVSVLHERLARSEVLYRVDFTTSGDSPFWSKVTLLPLPGSAANAGVLEAEGHMFSNKKWAQRSAAFAMLTDPRFQLLVG